MDNIQLVTVATHNEGYYNALKKSSQNNGYNLITLGWGKKWEGFIMKYKLLIENLNNFNDNDIIILIDAYDVIVTGSKNEVLEKFKKFNKPIVLSKDAKPDNIILNYLHSKIFNTCHQTNICAGLIMGYVWAFKKLIQMMCGKNLEKCQQLHLDDQMMLINVCNNKEFYNKYITIDFKNELFYNITGVVDAMINISELFTIKNNRLYVKNTDISPCFIHGPGSIDLNNICNFYNLPLGKKTPRDFLYRIKLYTKPQYLSRFTNEITMIIIFVLILIIVIVGLYLKDN
jgi:uncharacterized protein YlzI (FlbEa/FlbD family)